jgi:hypothetical protein
VPQNKKISARSAVLAPVPFARTAISSVTCTVCGRVHAPEPVQSAGIGGIGMIDDAVLENEGAEARPLAHICCRLGSSPGRVLDHDGRKRPVSPNVVKALGLQKVYTAKL